MKLNGGTFIAEIFNENLNLVNKLKLKEKNEKVLSHSIPISDNININEKISEEELIQLFK